MFSCPERIKSLGLGLPGLRQHFHVTHTQRLFPRGWPAALSRGMTLVFKFYFIYLFLAALGLGCFVGLPLDVASGGYSSLWCQGSVAPPVAERRLQVHRLQ